MLKERYETRKEIDYYDTEDESYMNITNLDDGTIIEVQRDQSRRSPVLRRLHRLWNIPDPNRRNYTYCIEALDVGE